MNFAGLASEFVLVFVLAGWIFIHKGFGSRDVIFFHFGLAGVPFSIMQLICDEVRKALIRRDDSDEVRRKLGKPGWFFRNSYY